MPTFVEALEAEVLNLSPNDRSRLLERLALSLPADPEVEDAWNEEADRREAQLADGTANLVSGDEAITRLREKLG